MSSCLSFVVHKENPRTTRKIIDNSEKITRTIIEFREKGPKCQHERNQKVLEKQINLIENLISSILQTGIHHKDALQGERFKWKYIESLTMGNALKVNATKHLNQQKSYQKYVL